MERGNGFGEEFGAGGGDVKGPGFWIRVGCLGRSCCGLAEFAGDVEFRVDRLFFGSRRCNSALVSNVCSEGMFCKTLATFDGTRLVQLSS